LPSQDLSVTHYLPLAPELPAGAFYFKTDTIYSIQKKFEKKKLEKLSFIWSLGFLSFEFSFVSELFNQSEENIK
jgi:hypothetical protein